MKRIINLRDKIAALLLLMLSGGYTFAQSTAGDASKSIYDTPPQRDLIQYIGPGIMLILVIYVGYRYWHDNRPDDKHTTHHQ